MTDALYLIVALAFAIWQLGRLGESPGRWGSLTLLVGATAGTMGVAGLPSHFAVFRLQCWGLFLVLPLWCLSAAAVCRSESRVGPPVLATIGLLLAAAGLDAFWYEPRALERNRHTVWSSKVDTPLRIAIVSDLQTDRPGTYELDALRLALDAQPDILLFPGDYLQVDDREQYEALGFELRELFQQAGVGAPRGAWAVQGNVDPGGLWPALFEGTPVHTVEQTRTYREDGFAVSALSFEDGFDPTLRLEGVPELHIAFAHGPDFALGEVDADILVAGHTHGGQVRLPFVDLALLTYSRLPRWMGSGVFDLGGGRTLVISRGVGLERGEAPRMRFNCRPEIVVLDVLPA